MNPKKKFKVAKIRNARQLSPRAALVQAQIHRTAFQAPSAYDKKEILISIAGILTLKTVDNSSHWLSTAQLFPIPQANQKPHLIKCAPVLPTTPPIINATAILKEHRADGPNNALSINNAEVNYLKKKKKKIYLKKKKKKPKGTYNT